MSANATCGTVNGPGHWSAPARRLRLEKPHETSTSGDSERGFRERRGEKPTRRAAFHFETVGVSPWNGPMLGTAFAAQVIAQGLDVHDRRSAGYAAPAPRPALFLDRSV